MKIIVISLILIILSLDILGFFSSFLVNENIIQYFIWGGLGVSAIIVALIALNLMKEGSSYSERMRSQGKSPLFGVLAMVVMVPVMTTTASFKGLPVVLSYITSVEGIGLVTVKSKPAGYHHRSCSGKVYVKEYSFFLNNRICGVLEGDWRRLKNGDKIILVGKKSIFGMNYTHYKKIKFGSN
ncbi:MAG TPA: hypothetical protein VKA31_10175 [Mariprofundaceae bacterium]|nr:hypothetical protein [Mariprofundaceae bacterium]